MMPTHKRIKCFQVTFLRIYTDLRSKWHTFFLAIGNRQLSKSGNVELVLGLGVLSVGDL